MSLFKRMKKAYQAGFGPSRFQAAGQIIHCPHCGRDIFEQSRALLNTSGLTLLGLDWLNQSASILICHHCGYIQWWKDSPE